MLFSFGCTEGFFDHQYLEMEFTNLLDFFLHRNSHQGNNISETTFSWEWPAFPTHTQISWNLKEVSWRWSEGWSEIQNSLKNESFIYFIHNNLSYITTIVLSNQFAGLFYHCCLWRESIYIFK